MLTDLKLDRPKTFLIVLLIWAGIYLPHLDVPKFKGEEARRVLPAIHMLKSGNWLVPYIGGQAYYKKPPLINWLVGLSFLLTGQQSETSARIPSVLFVLAFAAQLVCMRGSWLSLRARLICALIFLTTAIVVERGRLIEIEAVYTCLTGMAILWWLETYSQHGSPWSLWLVPGFLLACGVMTKGPLILLVFYCLVFCVLAYAWNIRGLICLPHLAAIIIIVGLPLGWAFLAAQGASPDQMVRTMSSQMLTRLNFGSISLPRSGMEILKACRNFLPWILFLPVLWNHRFVSQIEPQRLGLFKACRLSMVLGFVLINLMPGTVDRYSIPVLALACIPLGWALSLHTELTASDRWWRTLVLAGFVLCCFSSIIGILAIDPGITTFAILVLTICLTVVLIRDRGAFHTPLRLCLLTAVLMVVIMFQYVVFAATLGEKQEAAAAPINAVIGPNQKLYVYDPPFNLAGFQNIMIYLHADVEYVFAPEQISSDVHYLLLSQDNWGKLQAHPAISRRSPEVLNTVSHRHKETFKLVKLDR